MPATIPFTKMVGTGNDFIVVDTRRLPRLRRLPRRWGGVARALCDRRTGIGADGLLVLEPSRSADVRMRVFNPDGSEAKMCGNGARCVAQYVQRARRGRQPSVTIDTAAGMLDATVRRDRVAVRMMDPTALRLDLTLDVARRRIRLGAVNTGVPHAVVPVAALDAVDVSGLGRALRHHRAFAPQGTNVNFIQTDADHPDRLRIRTYERGVEEETRACGTGVTASALVYALSHGRRSGHHVVATIQVATKCRTRGRPARGGRGVPVAVGDRPSGNGRPKRRPSRSPRDAGREGDR